MQSKNFMAANAQSEDGLTLNTGYAVRVFLNRQQAMYHKHG
jgi:hypothetical protein